ncbi:unnamed protein product, partial [Notodromas monacha]
MSMTDDGTTIPHFVETLRKLAHREQATIEVNVEDIEKFDRELAEDVLANTRRYQALFSDTVFDLLPNYKEHDVHAKDALDVFIEHRLLVEKRARELREVDGGVDSRVRYPPELMRRYELVFRLGASSKHCSIREVKAKHIGKLVAVKGIVTRATDVR